MLPLVAQHPDQIAAWLSSRVGEPVRFSSAHAEWTRRGPRFTLEGLQVGRGDQVLDIGRAELLVAIYSGVLPGRPLTELKVRELSLTLEQDAERRWRLIGLPGQKKGAGDPLSKLEGFGELQIEKAQLALLAPALNLNARLPRVDLRLRVNRDRLLGGANVWSRVQGAPMSVVLDFQRGSRNGRIWAGGSALTLTDWAPLLGAAGLRPVAGSAELAVWGHLQDLRVSQVTVQTDVKNVRMRSLDSIARSDGRKMPVRTSFDQVQLTARWTAKGENWSLDVPTFDFTRGKQVARLGGLRAIGGKRYRIEAKSLDLSPLASLLALSPQLPAGLRDWLIEAQPQAVLQGVSLAGQPGGPWRGRLNVDALSLRPMGHQPGLSGLGAQLQFGDYGGVARLTSAPVKLEWPTALRQPLDLRVAGTLGAWRNGASWTLGGSGLQIRGDGFGARVRAELGFQGDDSKPTLDLVADLDPASVNTAKKFWIIDKMPPSTVKWLDNALVSGDVVNGRLAIGGDLDDWPFRNHEGVFDARAHLRDVTLKFNADWPAAEHLDLDVAFDGPGFTASGSGSLLGSHVGKVVGGIADFKAPWLDLDIAADGDASKLRDLLIASPLNKEYGEHLKTATIAGPAVVALNLHLPLKPELGAKAINGTVELHNAKLADSRWAIAFDQVGGQVRFSDKGFAADKLQVRFEGQPGQFSLDVGGFAGDPSLAASAALAGRFPAQTLIKRYDSLSWLLPWLIGNSEWKVGLRIPKARPGTKAPPSQLSIDSDLVGTAISLPAPLFKRAEQPLPLQLQVALPVEEGDVNLKLGSLMRLRGKIRGNSPINGAIEFGDGAFASVPAQGLAVHGQVATLDATGWIGFAAGGSGGSVLHEIDLVADNLSLVDRSFPQTHLRFQRAGANSKILLDAASLQGTVDIPSDLARGVQGRFTRMHFPEGMPGSAANAAVPAPVPGQETNPAKVPALDFAIDDLRLGKAVLGKTQLLTTPIANGMRITRFQSHSDSLTLDAAGEWVNAGTGTRSNLKLDFTANSLGQMLDALGFAGMVTGGKTKATLAGSWPGSPGAFSLAALSGTMNAEIGEGRLPNVEPGGSGRILGLLSLAEIPRRLSLDFSDFFSKGFSFNTVRGDFTFNAGLARTDNLRINGPAAEIRVSGAADMRNQQYDQRVEVLPKAGGMLPAIGMLAGGPIGAAVGAVAQAVFQKPLKQTTRVVYRVTGPWSKPKVDVIEKGPAKSTADNPRPTAAHEQ
jgi:uncharacterized protein (TIGR02099 family)